MDPSEILVCNVRGLNSSVRQYALRDVVNSTQVDVLCCQETKMQHIFQRNYTLYVGSRVY
jgi:exonuclease III